MGRPPKPIDLKVLEELAALQCTDGEIAAALDVSPATIVNRRESDPDFLKAYTKGRERGKRSLRRILFGIATDPTHKSQLGAAIWLSKQHLGMSDKREDKVEQHVTGELDLKGLQGKPYSERERMWRELVSGRG